MSNLPDFEALAIFAKVVELRSFAATAEELNVSKATISKAVTRLEERLSVRLFNRTSRRLALTEAGTQLHERAARILADGIAIDQDMMSQSGRVCGLIRLSVPVTYGIRVLAPLMPEFFKAYPEVTVDMQFDDARVDLIGLGLDAAIRIGQLPDSSLVSRKLATTVRHVIAAPSYLATHGRPEHPTDLLQHNCMLYANLVNKGAWEFEHTSGKQITVKPDGRMQVNIGEAMMPSVIAGLGIAYLPDFIAGDAIASGEVEPILTDWVQNNGTVHLILPHASPRPARMDALINFLVEHLGKRTD